MNCRQLGRTAARLTGPVSADRTGGIRSVECVDLASDWCWTGVGLVLDWCWTGVDLLLDS